MSSTEKTAPCPDHRQDRKRPQVRALCCECGAIRTTSTHAAHGEPDPDTVEFYGRHNEIAPRCTVQRKCQECQRQTRHAWLRDDLPVEEREQVRATLADVLSPAVTEILETLEACEVDVTWEGIEFREGQVVLLRQYLDDNCWQVTLNRQAHVAHLLGALEGAWCVLVATGRDVGADEWWRSVAGTPGDEGDPPYRYRMFIVPKAA